VLRSVRPASSRPSSVPTSESSSKEAKRTIKEESEGPARPSKSVTAKGYPIRSDKRRR
jgi:hypothetical protein